jgi:A/G-specific adenine glycosylase
MTVAQYSKKKFVKEVLIWGRANKRDFPWRDTKDAFKILVAELLLQRSRASTVIKVYNELFSRWPTVDTIANAPIRALKSTITPLGLLKRASLVKQIAVLAKNKIVKFNSIGSLLNLPGVGRYIAAATVSGAYNKAVPLVDGVSTRVYKRYFSLTCGNIEKTKSGERKQDIWDFVSTLIPKNGMSELNWAVLDLAAIICRPKKPKCYECPLMGSCRYVRNQTNKA